MTTEPSPVGPGTLPYQTIVEHLPVVVYIDTARNPFPRTVYISPNVEGLLGYPAELYLRDDDRWLETVHPDDLEIMKDHLEAAATARVPYELRYRFIHPDRGEVWVHDRAIPFLDEETGEDRWIGALEDVTARVETEQALEMSALRYATLLENLPAVVYEMDPDDDRRTRYVNRKIEELLGYTMSEWLDQPDMWAEILHPDDRERELAAHDLASTTGEQWQREYRLIGSKGEVVWVRDQAVLLRDLDGQPTRWQGVMIDISTEKGAQLALAAAHEELEFRVRARTAQLQETNELMGIEIAERRRAEEERARAEDHLGYLVHNLPAVIYLWQKEAYPDGSWNTFVGDQIAPMLGYSPEEWNNDEWRNRIHPHDLDRINAAAEHSLRTGEPFQEEFRYLAKDGHVVWVIDHATLSQRGPDGAPFLFEGVMIDITDLREAKEKAFTSEDRFREIVERGPVVLYAYSIDGDPPTVTIDYLSPQLEEMIGVPREMWEQDTAMWFETIHPDDRGEILASSRETWRTGEPWYSEYRVISGDGSIKWLADRGTCVERDADGRPTRFVGVIADIDARRAEFERLEEQLDPLLPTTWEGRAITWAETYFPDTDVSMYTYMSPNVFDVMGYTAEELVQESQNFPRLIHADDFERVVARWELVAPTGQWDDEYRVIARDGSSVWFQAHGWRTSPAGELPERWHGVTIDVTHLHTDDPSVGSPADQLEAPTEG
jgi:PAS domain S-box-containing protein